MIRRLSLTVARLLDSTTGPRRSAHLTRGGLIGVSTFTEKLLVYALGRGVEFHDMPAIRKIVREAAQQDYRFGSLVLGIVRSEPFQMRRIGS